MLEEPRVAGHQRGGGEADHLPDGVVPRHHRQHHAQRLVGRVGVRSADDTRIGQRGPGQELLGAVGVEAHGVRGLPHLAARLRERLAHFERDELGHLLDIAVEQIGGGVHPAPAGGEVRRPQGAVRRVGGGDARVDLGVVVLVEAGDGLTGGGVDGGDGHAGPFVGGSRTIRAGGQCGSSKISGVRDSCRRVRRIWAPSTRSASSWSPSLSAATMRWCSSWAMRRASRSHEDTYARR